MSSALQRFSTFTNPPEKNELNDLKKELFKIDLDFSKVSVDKINELLNKLQSFYQATYDSIAALINSPSQISFETAVQPLIDLDICRQKAYSLCTFTKSVHTDKAIRQASTDAEVALEKTAIDSGLRADVFQVLKNYQTNAFQKQKDWLDAQQIRYFDHLMRDYKREGLYIEDTKTREEIKNIEKEIAELSTAFQHNLDEENTSFTMTDEDLVGMPQEWLDKHRTAPGQYHVNLKYPDAFPVFDYAQNRATREKMYVAFNSRCEKENLPLFKKILELRQKKAELLGYKSHVDYATEVKMAKNGENVKSFLDEMNERFDPVLEKNIEDLTQFAREKEQDKNFMLQPYDVRYYKRLREEAKFDINRESIKEYFPSETVVNGTLKIFQDLLGLKFVVSDNSKTWHKDVVVYDVFNQSDNKHIGKFALDLYPRDGKYGHAAAFDLLKGCDVSSVTKQPNDAQQAFGAMVCNFPQNENIPFNDVGTFFHEFGHLMHFICGKAKLPELSSFNTEQDFIEAPSQMLENWCYEPEVLKILSSHYKTGEPLPDEIAKKLLDVDKLHAGLDKKRQLVFGMFDYLIHTMSKEQIANLDLKSFYQNLDHNMMHLPIVPGNAFPATFGHLVGGYDAGYYGYMMSLTYAADMFKTIFKDDPLSPEKGSKYRKEILEPAATQDAMVFLENFLGRKPIIDAFLEKCGLEENKPSPKMSM